ncbi:unnamed protein product [Clavelina lepadiformis]|uniref:Iodothyronine deiodinase n=1 Tax=Clavelina lepadiformis TaxID=159417 RepID=A0ABP0GIM1_CLALP
MIVFILGLGKVFTRLKRGDDSSSLEQRAEFKIKTHRAIEDRLSAAEILKSLDDFSLPLVVDTMKKEANLHYGGLPERMCVVLDGEVKYIGGIRPYNFNIEEMITYLEKIVNCSY